MTSCTVTIFSVSSSGASQPNSSSMAMIISTASRIGPQIAGKRCFGCYLSFLDAQMFGDNGFQSNLDVFGHKASSFTNCYAVARFTAQRPGKQKHVVNGEPLPSSLTYMEPQIVGYHRPGYLLRRRILKACCDWHHVFPECTFTDGVFIVHCRQLSSQAHPSSLIFAVKGLKTGVSAQSGS